MHCASLGIIQVWLPTVDRAAAGDARRVGLRLVPLIRVAGPDAVGMAHEQPRLDELTAEPEVLDEHGAVRRLPVAARLDTAMFWPFGRPIQRSLAAPSDQNGAFGRVRNQAQTSGGAPADAVLMQPVADSCCGTLSLPPPPAVNTSRWMCPRK